MNIGDAAYATVHDYPGGSEALAPRLGMSAAVLRNKVNPNNTTHHLSLAEAQRLVGLTGDKRILHALALEAGDVLVEGCAGEAAASDMAILECMALVFSGTGNLAKTIHEAFANGALSADEFDRIKAVAYVARRKIIRLMGRLETMVEGPRV